MNYTIQKTAKGFEVRNTLGAFITCAKTKKEARLMAGLLAGWRGTVTILKGAAA